MSPTIVFSAIALGVAGFLATSGDNFVILLGLYGDRTYRSRDVFVGYVGAIGLVVVAARLFAAVAHQAPPGIVGYLGVIPLGPGSRFRIPESGGRSVGSRRTSCRSS